MPQPSVFLPQKVVKDIGGVDESLYSTIDRDLWLRLMSSYKGDKLWQQISLANTLHYVDKALQHDDIRTARHLYQQALSTAP